MVNPFQRVIILLRRVMPSRKRKTEMEADVPQLGEDETTNIDLDHSGDGTGFPPPKKKPACSSKEEFRSCATGDYENHRFTAMIGPVLCDHRGVCVPLDNYKSQVPHKDMIVFNCPFGDSWDDHLYNFKETKKILTGIPVVDTVLEQLKGRGVEAKEQMHSGRCGTVVLCFQPQEAKYVVLKFPHLSNSWVYSPHFSEARQTCEEIDILRRLQHPNIVEMLSWQQIEGQMIMHLEYCENGNLEQLLNCHMGKLISEGAARKFFRDLIEGLQYLHHQCIVHLDIRPSNLLLSKFHQLKIADFGEAERFQAGDELFIKNIGVIGYMAPENMYTNKMYNPRMVDIWAAGCVLFRMVCGKPPFLPFSSTQNSLELIKKGIAEELQRSNAVCSLPLRNLLEKMLLFAPETRETIVGIRYDEWFMNNCTNVRISGAYLLQHAQKRSVGSEELRLKQEQFI